MESRAANCRARGCGRCLEAADAMA
ncbi:hypothetical protein K3756_07385 [Sulfitobacter sp. S190]|nr:hypothetical protein K3756_07385 [Sulfitobacter sp. S190]